MAIYFLHWILHHPRQRPPHLYASIDELRGQLGCYFDEQTTSRTVITETRADTVDEHGRPLCARCRVEGILIEKSITFH